MDHATWGATGCWLDADLLVETARFIEFLTVGGTLEGRSIAQQLRELSELHQSGALDDHEFARAKRQVLGLEVPSDPEATGPDLRSDNRGTLPPEVGRPPSEGIPQPTMDSTPVLPASGEAPAASATDASGPRPPDEAAAQAATPPPDPVKGSTASATASPASESAPPKRTTGSPRADLPEPFPGPTTPKETSHRIAPGAGDSEVGPPPPPGEVPNSGHPDTPNRTESPPQPEPSEQLSVGGDSGPTPRMSLVSEPSSDGPSDGAAAGGSRQALPGPHQTTGEPSSISGSGSDEVIVCQRCSNRGRTADAYCQWCGFGGWPIAQRHDWFVTVKGQRVGPLDAKAIDSMRAEGRIISESLVWREGLEGWRPAGSTELLTLFYDPDAASRPPSLPPEQVDNRAVWVLAFAPVLGSLASGALEIAFGLGPGTLWWIVIVLNIGLAVTDERRLDAAGWDTSGWSLWVLIVPVYLFMRARRLTQSNGYAWTWVGMFFVSFIIDALFAA